MTGRILADLPKNGRERVRVSLSEFRGSRFADIRVFATASDGALIPTKQGVSLRAGMLRKTIEALEQAEQALAGTAGREGGA